MAQKQYSIEELGLKRFLNLTQADHNDLGFQQFDTMIKTGLLKKTQIAESFNITTPTLYKWLEYYKKLGGAK